MLKVLVTDKLNDAGLDILKQAIPDIEVRLESDKGEDNTTSSHPIEKDGSELHRFNVLRQLAIPMADILNRGKNMLLLPKTSVSKIVSNPFKSPPLKHVH